MKTKIEDTDIPSERIIKLILSSREFSSPGSIYLRIDPKFGMCVDWIALQRVMEKVREVVRPGCNPSDRYTHLIEKLNDQLEIHSVVEVFGSQKPEPKFGMEVGRV